MSDKSSRRTKGLFHSKGQQRILCFLELTIHSSGLLSLTCIGTSQGLLGMETLNVLSLKVQEFALGSDAGWCADHMNGVMVSSLLRLLLLVFNVAITLSEKWMD